MKNYTEYNSKIGIKELLTQIELPTDTKGFVREMNLGEMISSVKVPHEGFSYDENGELLETADTPQNLRVDYLASLRPVSFEFKILEFNKLS